MHETQERETLKDATLSTAKHLSVTQCNAWWPTFLFHSSSLSTVALPPRVAPIPVRFNRVYSKVTLGTLSVVYSPFFIPWMHKFVHKVKGADCPYRLSTRIFPSLLRVPFALPVSPSRVCDWDVSLWLPRCQQSIHVSSSMPPTRHTVLLFALSSRAETQVGDGNGASHIYELNKGWMLKPGVRRDMNQFIWLSKKKERCERRKATKAVTLLWSVAHRLKYCTVYMPMHAVNMWTIRVCIKWSVSVIYIIICMSVSIALYAFSQQSPWPNCKTWQIYKKRSVFVGRWPCLFMLCCLQHIGNYRFNRSRCHNPYRVGIWNKIP